MNLSQLSNADRQKIKVHVLANTNTVVTPQGTVQIKDVTPTPDNYTEVAQWYNAVASPSYWIWKASTSRADVYHRVGPEGTVWDWNTFKAQSVTEQNTWAQMFMGDLTPCHLLTFREGTFKIFSGSAAQNTQRAHVLSVYRRQALRIESVIAVAVASVGGITPDVDNGNTLGDTLGGITNPAVLPITTSSVYVEGNISQTDLATIVSGIWE